MHNAYRRGCCGPGCLATLLALALWLPQVGRTVALVSVGRTPPTGPLVITTGLVVGVVIWIIGWRLWRRHRRTKESI